MKRILLLSSEFPPGPGGIGVHACQFAVCMTDLGWQIQVLTLQDYASDEEIRKFNDAQPFTVRCLERKFHWMADVFHRFSQLIETVRNWQPDVLVVTGDRMVWLTAIAYLGRFIPSRLFWVAVWHGVVPSQVIAKCMVVWAFGRPDLVIAVSQYSLERLLQMGTRPRRMKVITNGADEQAYMPDPGSGPRFRSENDLPIDAKVLLTVGHVSERKGQDIVIRALPEMLKIHPQVHYLLVGLPTNQPELERLADELGVRPHVHFLGKLPQENLRAVYNACDIFVLVSRHDSSGRFEGYGIVVAEAALCAKPAVVAGNSGLAEAIQDGVTGLIVPENNPSVVEQAVRLLLNDPTLCLQMGQNARKRALREQTWSTKMKEYDAELNHLIGG